MIVRGKIVGTDASVSVCIDGARISAVRDDQAAEDAIGGDDVWIAPAIFDVQVNGAGGIDYTGGDLTVEKIGQTSHWLHSTGTGKWCPTVITSSAEVAIKALGLLVQACEESEILAGSFAGLHVEGPYISSEEGARGAHPLEHTRDPDWEEFQRYQDAAQGRIVLVTLAPEREGSLPFIEKAAAAGLVVSIGHTGASRERIREAVSAGATMSTHLGNGSHGMIPRLDNYIWEQLAADQLWAGIIPDGHHLPEPVLKCFYRAKQKQRICLVSDVASIAGLPPGRYGEATGGAAVDLDEHGKISLAGTPYLAGAGLFLDCGVANMVRYTDASLADAIQMATLNPARLLGLDDRLGSIEQGKEASLTLFRWESSDKLEIVATIVKGQTVYTGN